MAKFEAKPVTVKAIRLTWTTWDAVCGLRYRVPRGLPFRGHRHVHLSEDGSVETDCVGPGKSLWVQVGRRYVAHVGSLSASVFSFGSRERGTQRWFVENIFGTHHAAPLRGSSARMSLEVAVLAAEEIMIRELRALASYVKRRRL